MKIIMISDWESRGGAGTAANRLAHGFMDLGHEVMRVLRFPDQENPPWQRFILQPEAPDVGWDELPNLPARDQVCAMLDECLTGAAPDAISIHNIHGGGRSGWSMRLAEISARHAPTLFTMHDMWSFTGRCAYNDECQGFLTHCDSRCPTPDEYPPCPPQAIGLEFNLKKESINNTRRLAAVSPSAWLQHEAEKGLWRNQLVRCIPNGIPLDVFSPAEREAIKAEYGLTLHIPTLLVASAGLDDPRKGTNTFFAALSLMRTRPLNVLVMGRGRTPESPDGINIIRLGFVESETDLAKAYNAADIYVHPALMDNLPNVVAEAQACGTPCLALPSGGVPEMILPGVSGWLAEKTTPQALAAALDSALTLAHGIRAKTRKWATERYSQTRQAREYLDLFSEVGTSY